MTVVILIRALWRDATAPCPSRARMWARMVWGCGGALVGLLLALGVETLYVG